MKRLITLRKIIFLSFIVACLALVPVTPALAQAQGRRPRGTR